MRFGSQSPDGKVLSIGIHPAMLFSSQISQGLPSVNQSFSYSVTVIAPDAGRDCLAGDGVRDPARVARDDARSRARSTGEI
jgi:hypothetical protein